MWAYLLVSSRFLKLSLSCLSMPGAEEVLGEVFDDGVNIKFYKDNFGQTLSNLSRWALIHFLLV